MKRSELSFFGSDVFNKQSSVPESKKNTFMYFDWNKAAEIIKEKLKTNPNLIAKAGLQGDWDYTGGIIFEDGKPTNDKYTYLSSNWANPTVEIDGEDMDCFTTEKDKYSSDSKWDKESLAILGIDL